MINRREFMRLFGATVWTGLYPHSNGVMGNSMPLANTAHTIGQRLTDQGIHCAFIGKWHLSGAARNAPWIF